MEGGDVTMRSLRLRPEGRPYSYRIFRDAADADRVSFWSIVIILAKAGMSTDGFMMAPCYSATGILSVGAVGIVLLLFTQFSFHIFIRCWVQGEAYQYDQIWKMAIGEKTSIVALILVILSYMHFAWWGSIELWDDFSIFLSDLWPEAPAIVLDPWVLCYGITAISTFPALFIRRFTGFVYISAVSMVAEMVSIVCLTVYAVKGFKTLEIDPTKEFPMFIWDPVELLSLAVRFAGALFAAPMIPYIMCDMERPTIGRCMAATWVTNTISVVFHVVVSFIGFVCFVDNDPHPNIFYCMVGTIPEVIVGRIASGVVTVCCNMFFTYFLAKQVAALIYAGSENHTVSIMMSGLVVITLSLSMNFVYPAVGLTFEILGGISGIFLVFVLPAVFYLLQFRFTNLRWGIMSVILLVVGIPFSALVAWLNLSAI